MFRLVWPYAGRWGSSMPKLRTSGGEMMTQTQLKETESKALPGAADLHPDLIKELSRIVQEAEKAKEPEVAQVSSWYYSVPCPGVRYYTYVKPQSAAT